MLPLYSRLDGTKPLFRISFGNMSILVLSLPLGSLLFCILWSMMFEFERSTSTHCDVPNFLPSISAAIGNYEPQKTVWKLSILLHLPARLAVARMYYKHYRETIRRNRRLYALVACLLNVVEDLALMSLSVWNSSDNYIIHRNSFIIFIACSELYMLITFFLQKHGRKTALLAIEERSLKYKRNLFLTNLSAFALAGYCFMRHNSHCEPGVYSIFAYFEYWFVWSMNAYEMTALMDLTHFYLTFDLEHGFTLEYERPIVKILP